MNNRIVLSESAFFGTTKILESWAAILADCLARKESLSVTLEKNEIVLQRVPMHHGSNTITLYGGWRVSGFEAMSVLPMSGQLFVPFYFNVVQILLPYSLFGTLGSPHRPIADFFMRNVFLGLGVGAELSLIPVSGAQRGSHIRKLQQHYYFVFKGYFPEPTFDEANALEVSDLILANGFAEALEFRNPLLESGARHLRTLVGTVSDARSPAALHADLRTARARMLVHFR